jgi:hypothetical protein
MVTHFPVSPKEFTSEPEQAPQGEGFGERVLDRVRATFCGLHGHDSLLQFKRDRMFLKCVSCGYESPGWELNEAPPIVVASGDPGRLTLTRPPLLGTRRIA